MGPGEVSVVDEHFPTPAPTGVRPLRPRTASERAFLELGAEAEAYLRSGAAAGAARLSEQVEEALGLAASRGAESARAALGRSERASLEWLKRSENLCLAGPPGTGKSHLGAALGRAACDAGKRVRLLGGLQGAPEALQLGAGHCGC